MATAHRPSIAEAGFEVLPKGLAEDVHRSLDSALEAGTDIAGSTTTLAALQTAVTAAVRNIETHERGQLLRRFLENGPLDDKGEPLKHIPGTPLDDEEVATVIAFLYAHTINCFKGALTELLALGAVARIVTRLRKESRIPNESRLEWGETLRTPLHSGSGYGKGPDLLVSSNSGSIVVGIGEVKSYRCSLPKLERQLESHKRRLAFGLLRSENDQYWSGELTRVAIRDELLRISVVPSDWRLDRAYSIEETETGSILRFPAEPTPATDDAVSEIGSMRYHITLAWSEESIAAAAYGLLEWYFEHAGAIMYDEEVPESLEGMTPNQAGLNDAKEKLYYALLRCRGRAEEQRAIAIYNTICFGYALGMNFGPTRRKRAMLWPEDLREIATDGSTQQGCRIWG